MRHTAILIGLCAGLAAPTLLGAAAAPQAGRVEANGIRIAYESYGPADRETILLIGGAWMQLTEWPPDLCRELVKRGYRVVVFDNRDSGLSTRFDAAGKPDMAAVVQALIAGKPAPVPYTLYDMARDTVGLLDALGIRKAHIAGVSMGGIVAQIAAAEYPERVLSLTSMMATDGKPGLPLVAKPERVAGIPPPGPDDDRKAYIERQVKLLKAIESPDYPADETAIRERVNRAVERAFCPACEARQAAASLVTGLEDRRAKLKTVQAPAVVVHGAEDPVVPLEAGRDVAANIPGAGLRIIPGMGHDIPVPLVATVADAIAAAAARAQH